MNKKNDIDTAIEYFNNIFYSSVRKISEAQQGNLIDIINLDDNYDDPDAVLQALDAQNKLYSYFAYLFHLANKDLERVEEKYSVWKSQIDGKIKKKLFDENIKAGMTANNSKPSAKDVEDHFKATMQKDDKYLLWQKRIDKARERVSNLRIMRDTIDRKQNSLQNITNLLGKCIDRGIINPRIRKKAVKFKKRINQGEEL